MQELERPTHGAVDIEANVFEVLTSALASMEAGMPATAMTIGEVAKQTALGIETIRFYERQGLIPDPPRRRSGYRQYPNETIARLLFIKRTKELGFSLKQIAEILALRVDPETTAGAIKQRVEEKIEDVEGKIRSLRRIRKALVELDESCCGCGPTSECPILDSLDAI